MPRTITLTDQAAAFEQLRAAMETDLTLQAIAKERIYHERAAQMEWTTIMMRHGVKVITESPPCAFFAPRAKVQPE